jgi:hypothetical protein
MKRGYTLGLVALLAVGSGVAGYLGTRPEATAAQQPVVQPAVQPGGQPGVRPDAGMPAGGPKYTVIDTEGTNLLVVDNSKNVLYFYTCDHGKSAGEPLKLRGSIDLNQVGQPSIKPKGQPTEEPKGDRPKGDRPEGDK